MIYLKKNYLKKYLENKTCNYILYPMNHRFECEYNIIKNLDKLTFFFDSFQFIFDCCIYFLYGKNICNYYLF